MRGPANQVSGDKTTTVAVERHNRKPGGKLKMTLAKRRLGGVLFLFIVSALLWWAYVATSLPPGVESKGDSSDWIPWLSLAGAIVSFLTGLVTLSLEVLKLKQLSKPHSRGEES
jgi:hypothetical protein